MTKQMVGCVLSTTKGGCEMKTILLMVGMTPECMATPELIKLKERTDALAHTGIFDAVILADKNAENLDYMIGTVCKEKRPEVVYIAGMDTECGVLLCAMELRRAGIRPVVLTNYCASSAGLHYHHAGILTLKRLLGEENLFYGEISCKTVLAQAWEKAMTDNAPSPALSLEAKVVARLKEKHLHISFAESCTAGLLAARLVNVPDASSVFDESHVTYANHAKVKYVNVSPQTIEKYGVVSEEVAREMAIGVAQNSTAEVGVSVSGIAGPGGGSETKPVGMVCFGFLVDGKTHTYTKQFGNIGRQAVRDASTAFAFRTLLDLLD